MEGKSYLKWTGIAVLIFILASLIFNSYQVLILQKDVGELKTDVNKLETEVKTIETQTGSISPAPTNAPNQPLEIEGTVRYSNLEGGCWYISTSRLEIETCTGDKCPLSDVPKYAPINLSAELKKEGLRAKFKLALLPETATTCQIGPAVKILEYQILK